MSNRKRNQAIPLRAEKLDVQTREIERGRVRIDKTIEHIPFAEDVEVSQDVVRIERTPHDEVFEVPPQTRQDGDTLIIPVVEEEVVVTRRYRVVEEIRIIKGRESHTERIEESLAREVATVSEPIDEEDA